MSSNLTKLVQSTVKTIQDNEKLAIPLLSAKLNKLAEIYPYDQTIVITADVLGKASEKNRLFITRAEFRDLYKRLYARNTKFAEYFADELGQMDTLSTPQLYEKHEQPITDLYKDVNPVLSNVLNSALDSTIPLKLFSKKDAETALLYVNSTLDGWNIKSSKVEIANGNEHFILVKANYETPKGLTSVFVPVEIKAGKVLQPSVFVGKEGLTELNHNNIKEYLLSHVNKKPTTVSYGTDVVMPKPAQLETFEEKFKSALGIATFKFGVDKVNLGRDAIVRSLAGFGVGHSQVKVVDTQDTTIVYGVSIGGKVAFKVPVKLANNKILTPELMICNGSVLPFSKANINKLFLKNETDHGVAATTSALHGLKTPDLIQVITDAAAEHNYAKAEDALNVLQQSGDAQGHKLGLEAYMGGLAMVKTAESQRACSMIIKSSASQHPVCGHTGLPTHKVYQDEHGVCHPMYRKNIPMQTDSAYFNNYKILG